MCISEYLMLIDVARRVIPDHPEHRGAQVVQELVPGKLSVLVYRRSGRL